MKFLHFVLYTYCICSFQVYTCGAPSLNLVLPCVAHLLVIILPLVSCAYLVQHSHPCVFLLSDSLLIFVLFFFTLSDLLTSSVPRIFASLRNMFLCCKTCMPHFSGCPIHGYILVFPSPSLRHLPPFAPAQFSRSGRSSNVSWLLFYSWLHSYYAISLALSFALHMLTPPCLDALLQH